MASNIRKDSLAYSLNVSFPYLFINVFNTNFFCLEKRKHYVGYLFVVSYITLNWEFKLWILGFINGVQVIQNPLEVNKVLKDLWLIFKKSFFVFSYEIEDKIKNHFQFPLRLWFSKSPLKNF